jgi:four helix bundle protein
MRTHNFQELKVWQKGRELVKDIYTLTKELPKEELFGLTSQMRRAAVSIPSNIAEGCGRNTDKQLALFIDYAMGSSCELFTQLLCCVDVQYFEENKIKISLNKIQEIQKMCISLKNTLKNIE